MVIPVVAGIVQVGRGYGKVLLKKHGPCVPECRQVGMYEFPGGKVEEDETLEEALARELWEELAIELRGGVYRPRVVHAQINRYSHSSNSYLVVFMECFLKWTEPQVDPVVYLDHRDCILVDLKSIQEVETLPGAVEALRSI